MSEQKIFDGIDTFIIRVSDYSLSKQWYQEKLGFKPVWEDEIMKLVVLDAGNNSSITLWQTDSELKISNDTAAYPIFRTKDARKSRDHLISSGVSTGELIEEENIKFFKFYDLDNNILEACEST